MELNGHEIVVPATRVRATDPRHSKSVVSAGQETFPDVSDTGQTEHAIGAGVLLIVEVAEPVEMAFEDRMQIVAAPGDVAMP